MFNYLVKDLNLIHILPSSGSKSWLIKKLNCELIFLQQEGLEAGVRSRFPVLGHCESSSCPGSHLLQAFLITG